MLGIGNISKNLVASWDLQLFKAEIQLMEVLILEHVRKLSVIEENFNSLFMHHTVQEDWLFRTRNNLEKLKKTERRRKLKKLKNVVNLSKRNLNYQRSLYCRKDSILLQHATI